MNSCLRVLLAIAMWWVGMTAHGAEALRLDPRVASVDAWSAVTVWRNAPPAADIDAARRHAEAFLPPEGATANFGVQREALWLRLAVQATAGGRWVMNIDYPPLNRVDVFVLSQGQLRQRQLLGTVLPFDQRPIKSRAHALALELPAGEVHEIYLRVASSSSLLVPIAFHRDDAFVGHEGTQQLLQGLAFGLTLALLAYSAANGSSLHDPLFGFYALMLMGVSAFFVSYEGVGPQYLWNESGGLLAKLAPLGVLTALAAASLFVAGAMQTATGHPRITLGLRTVALLATGAFAASVLGLLDYRTTQLAATLLGPVPIVLALWVAVPRARRGDRIARLMVMGWGAYIVGALSMAGLLRGWLPANGVLRHLFQVSALVEMLAWVRVLGLRIEGIRSAAERAAHEQQVLHSMAHTDALTGLPNRRGLHEALSKALHSTECGRMLAVYLIDLDGFKPVNDRLGHDAGDQLLVQLGQRLRTAVRARDVVARLGGDEFVVMATELRSEADAQRVGSKLLQAVAEPFDVAGQACRVGLTVGFALSPADGSNAEALIKFADAAMYAGKRAGRGCVQRAAVAAAAGG